MNFTLLKTQRVCSIRLHTLQHEYVAVDALVDVVAAGNNQPAPMPPGDAEWALIDTSCAQDLHIPHMTGGIYHWNLIYDNFLGYKVASLKTCSVQRRAFMTCTAGQAGDKNSPKIATSQ